MRHARCFRLPVISIAHYSRSQSHQRQSAADGPAHRRQLLDAFSAAARACLVLRATAAREVRPVVEVWLTRSVHRIVAYTVAVHTVTPLRLRAALHAGLCTAQCLDWHCASQ